MEIEQDFYEGQKEKEQESIKGITGTVTSYTFTNVSYPCIIFKRGVQLPKHKLTVLKNMINAGNHESKDVSLYFDSKDGTYKMGALSGLQVEAFLDLVGLDSLVGYYEDGTELSGSKIYTLGTIL